MSFYFDGDRIKLRPPQANVLLTDGVTSIVLYREKQFQVELVVCAPGTVIPEHTHPDVESYEIAISGALEFFVSGQQAGFFREPRADGLSRDFGKFVPVPSDAPHHGRAGAEGACFISVQHWREGVAPSHVGLNWKGRTSGPLHDKALA